jgi:hypothetical protein
MRPRTEIRYIVRCMQLPLSCLLRSSIQRDRASGHHPARNFTRVSSHDSAQVTQINRFVKWCPVRIG